jgi:hypothetical protein
MSTFTDDPLAANRLYKKRGYRQLAVPDLSQRSMHIGGNAPVSRRVDRSVAARYSTGPWVIASVSYLVAPRFEAKVLCVEFSTHSLVGKTPQLSLRRAS